jgi:diaminohydroxyphosphoribosylaminopyrimidine deaminase/5-amino-6-(5-phosphoribosylamino)uracil reductase
MARQDNDESGHRERPYVIAKAAMSLDGRIATAGGESRWITGTEARLQGHELRRRADAIVVGAGTVIADDPALTARTNGEVSHPLRVVLDSTARSSPAAAVFSREGKGALLATTAAAPEPRLARFKDQGVETLVLPADARGRLRLDELLLALHARGVETALVEGGGETLGAFNDADLIDEVWLFLAPILIGGGRAAFVGAGARTLAGAQRFAFDPPKVLGSDLLFRGLRRERD